MPILPYDGGIGTWHVYEETCPSCHMMELGQAHMSTVMLMAHRDGSGTWQSCEQGLLCHTTWLCYTAYI